MMHRYAMRRNWCLFWCGSYFLVSINTDVHPMLMTCIRQTFWFDNMFQLGSSLVVLLVTVAVLCPEVLAVIVVCMLFFAVIVEVSEGTGIGTP